MTFTAPFTAVPGEIITAAGWNTSARDNINHIWGVIGGNPGTSGLVPHSIGASSGAWGKVTDDLLNDPKVSQIPTTITDANSNTGSGFYVMNLGAATNAPFDGYWYLDHIKYASGYYRQIASSITDNNNLWTRVVAAGTPSSWVKVWTANNDSTSSGLDADTVRGAAPSNTINQIAVNNGVLNPNLNAALLTGLSPGNSSGQIPVSNGVMSTGLNAQLLAGLAAGNASGNIPVSNGAVNANFNASLLNSLTTGNGAGNIPINNTGLNTGLNAQYAGGLVPGNAISNIAVNNGVLCVALYAANSDAIGGRASAIIPSFAVVSWPGTGGSNRLVAGNVPKYMRIVGTNGANSVVHDVISATPGQNVKSASGGAFGVTTQTICSSTRFDTVFGGYRVDSADGSDAAGYSYTAYILY